MRTIEIVPHFGMLRFKFRGVLIEGMPAMHRTWEVRKQAANWLREKRRKTTTLRKGEIQLTANDTEEGGWLR